MDIALEITINKMQPLNNDGYLKKSYLKLFLKFEALFKHHMLWATCTIVLFLAIGNEVLAALVFVSAMLAAIQEL